MRKVIVSNLVSLDGFMARANGDIDWFVVNDEFFADAYDLLSSMDTILLGRVTYQGMVNYWPTATIDESILADKMNTTPKIVFSRTLENAPWGKWNNASVMNRNIAKQISKLKQQPGKDMVIYGSSSIVTALTQLRLIDEYQMFVNPVVLGSGKPLFEGITQPINLKLLGTKNFKTGVVMLSYAT